MTISATILQNELKRRLPPEFVSQFPEGIEIAYAAIPVIPSLNEPTRTQVREAFADSLSIVWKVMIGFSAAGFVTLFLLKEVPMQKHTDETYGLDDGSGRQDMESQIALDNGVSKRVSEDSSTKDARVTSHGG